MSRHPSDPNHPKHVPIKAMAEIIGRSPSNIRETYFNKRKPQNLRFGEVIEMGSFLKINEVTWDELTMVISTIKSHREYIRARI